MKRQTILLLLSVLLLSGGAAAQSTKEQTLEDLNRTAALYYCYENHPRAAATPAPEGYEPFYISHYGRHGSRWHASESVYENPRAKLRKAAEAGKLTPLGEEALRRIEVVADDARHRYGDLSPRGVREHRGIAERMYCSFPEIFSTADGRLCRIRARSTLVPRCMLSMAAANERLKELNPAIDITREASKRYLDYMFRMTEANKIKKEIKQRIAELREREIDPSRFVRALVTDPSLVGNRKEQLRFMNDLYCVASVMQDVDYLDCSFYDLFTPDELYAFYAVRNYQMYLEEGLGRTRPPRTERRRAPAAQFRRRSRRGDRNGRALGIAALRPRRERHSAGGSHGHRRVRHARERLSQGRPGMELLARDAHGHQYPAGFLPPARRRRRAREVPLQRTRVAHPPRKRSGALLPLGRREALFRRADRHADPPLTRPRHIERGCQQHC